MANWSRRSKYSTISGVFFSGFGGNFIKYSKKDRKGGCERRVGVGGGWRRGEVGGGGGFMEVF